MDLLYPILLGFLSISFGILAVRDHKLATTVFALFLPTYLLRFSIGPVPLTLLEVFFLILLGVWVYQKGWKGLPTDLIQKKSPWLWLGAGVLAVAIVSFVAHPSLAALNILKSYYLEPALFGLILLSTFKKRSDWRSFFLFLALTTIPLTLVAFAQRYLGAPIPSPWDFELRATSVFEYPNALGLYLAPITAMSGAMLITLKERIWLLPITFGLAGIVLAETEAALIAIPAAILLGLFYAFKSKKMRVGILALIVLGVLTALAISPLRSKLLLKDYSGTVRRSQWTETVELLKDKPLFGAGLDNYPEAFAPYHQAEEFEVFQYPHTIVLNIWVELGILGVLVFLAALYICLKSLKRIDANPLPVAILIALLTMLIHGLVDVPFFKNDLAFLTVIFLSALIFLDLRGKQEQALKAKRSLIES